MSTPAGGCADPRQACIVFHMVSYAPTAAQSPAPLVAQSGFRFRKSSDSARTIHMAFTDTTLQARGTTYCNVRATVDVFGEQDRQPICKRCEHAAVEEGRRIMDEEEFQAIMAAY